MRNIPSSQGGTSKSQSNVHRSSFASWRSLLLMLPLLAAHSLFGQAAFIDFNSVGQFTNNFSGRNFQTANTVGVWYETNGAGVSGSASLDGINNSGNDTTMTYGTDAFDFSTDGKTLNVSMMVKIKSPTAAAKALQLGFISSTNLSMNDFNPNAFMSVRFGSSAAASFAYNAELQQRPTTGPTLTTNTSANFNVAAGNWYQLSATFLNIKSTLPNGYRVVTAQVRDFGASGTTPGAVLWITNNIDLTNINLTADSTVYPAFRSTETAGADNLDNFAVSTMTGAPVITVAPVDQIVTAYRPVTFSVKVDGTPDFSFTWYTNDVLAAGATRPTLTIPQATPDWDISNIRVAITNSVGGIESAIASLTVMPDEVKPNVVSVGSVDGTAIGVAFDEEIVAAGANIPANYSVTPSTTVTSATLQPDGRRVKLTLGSAISGAFTVTVSGVSDLAGNSLATTSASGTVMGLTPSDIGYPAFAGSAISYNTGDIDEAGGGFDFWFGADQGHVTLGPRSGDFDFQVRVANIVRNYQYNTLGNNRDDFTKAVIMVRESMLPSAREVYANATPVDVSLPAGGNVLQMVNRTSNLGTAAQLGSSIALPSGGAFPNVWMRLRRVNNTFTTYYSTNATPTVWYQLSQAGNLVMNDATFAGVGLTAHYDGDRPASAQFRNLGDWSVPGAQVAILTNSGASLTMNLTWPATNGTIAITALATNLGTSFPSNEIQFVWQRGDGLGNFTNVLTQNAAPSSTPSPTSAFSSYSTAPLTLADNGAQYRVIAKGPGGISATGSVSTLTINYFDQAAPTVGLASVLLGSNTLSLIFNEPLDLLSVSNLANYVITNSLGQAITVTGVTLQAPGEGTNNVTRIILTTSTVLTNNTSYIVRLNNIRGTNGVPIALNTLATVPTLGTIKVEIFANLAATALMTDLTNTAKYLSNVAEYVFWTNAFSWNHSGSAFTDRSGWNSYGGRLSGLFVPPSNGLYRFYIRHDDAGALWMNTNAVNSWDPAGKSLLAFNSVTAGGYVNPGVTNTSITVDVPLIAGTSYYVEGLWKENSGGDGFSMMFREIGNTNAPGVTENAGGAFFLPIVNNLYAGVAATPTPVRVEMFTGITGGTVALLTNATKFINNTPDWIVNVPGFGYNWETLTGGTFGNTLDNYGVRISSYFLAPSNAVYRFFIKSDDDSQFFINTNGIDPAGKISVAYLPGNRTFYRTNSPDTTNTGCSFPITLTNGQLYYIEALLKDNTGNDGFGMTFLTYASYTDATNSTITPASNTVALANSLRPIPSTSFTPAWPYSPSVLAEIYQNNGVGFSGTSVSDLQNHTKFQAAMPDALLPMRFFGINRDQPNPSIYPNDNYGARVSGYFVAPSNCQYRFFIKNDDGGVLFMNTNGIDVAGKVQIAVQTFSRNVYTNADAMMSAPITLTNGQRYYMEYLFKEGTSGDGCSVTFFATNGTTVPAIPGANSVAVADFFAPTIGPVTCNNIAMSTTANTLADGATVTFSVNGVTGAMPIGVQWRRNGVAIPGANGFNFTYTVTPADVGITTFSAFIYNQQSSIERFANLNLATVFLDFGAPEITGVIGNRLQNEVTVTYSENVLAATATNIANYSISGLTITSAYLRANNQVALLTSAQTPGTRYTVVVNNVKDTSRTGNIILPNSAFSFTSWTMSRGFVTLDQFTGLNSSGVLIQYLTTELKFINNTPDTTLYSTVFGFGMNTSGGFNNTTDQYGMRAYAWFIAPSNGLYRFYIRSDDESMLFMNTNSASSMDPAGKTMIAAAIVGAGKNYNDLLGAGPCMSSNIFLNGGQMYYMEVLLREGSGNDGFSVAFREAGDPSTPANTEVIPGYYFANVGNPDVVAAFYFVSHPASVTTGVRSLITMTASALYVPAVSPNTLGNVAFQWQRYDTTAGDFVNVLGNLNPTAASAAFTTSFATPGTYQIRALANLPGITITSAVATVTVTNPVIVGPTVPAIAWASASTNRTTITAQFSEAVTSATANDMANYAVVDSVAGTYTVSSAVLGADAKTVTLTVTPSLPTANNASVTLTAANIICVDDAQVGGGSYTFHVPDGFLRFSFYTNSAGGTLPAVFPTAPPAGTATIFQTNGTLTTNLFWTAAAYGIPTAAQLNYAVRLNGYFIPPSNGVYRIFQGGDDQSAFFMNTNAVNSHLPAGAVRLVLVGGSLGYGNVSAATPFLTLNAGQRYYIEVQLAQGTGGEYVRAAFREFGNYGIPDDNNERISALFLSSPANLSVIASTFTPTFPESATNVLLGAVVGSPAYIQWYTNNVLVSGATNATFALPTPLPLSYSGVNVQVIATNSYSSVSNQFTISVDADATTPTIVSVARCNTWTNLIVNFSEMLGAASATNPANYVVVDGAGNIIPIAAVFLRPDGRSVSISIAPSGAFDPNTTYYVTNNAIADRSVAGNTIPANSVVTYNPLVFTTNLLAMDFYGNISGGSLSNLLNDARFQNNTPDLQMALAGLEFHQTNLPFSGQANYGVKVFGWFVPPSNAVYRFSFRSDDVTSVFMNTNGITPNGKVQIGTITNCCNIYTSTIPVLLTANNPYYIEFLMGNGTGQEYFSATWRGFPDQFAALSTPAPTSPGNNGVGWGGAGYYPSAEIGSAAYFGVYADPTIVSNFNFTLQPTPSATNVAAGTSVRLAVMATNAPSNGYIWYQWQADDSSGNFTNLGPSTNYISNFEMLGNRSNYVANFYYTTTLRAVAQLPGGLSITSLTATVTVPTSVTALSVSAFSSPATNSVTVVFDRPVLITDAQETLYYLVNGGSINVSAATLQPDGRTVILGMDGVLPDSVSVDVGPIYDSLMQNVCFNTLNAITFRASFYGDIGSAPLVTDPLVAGSFVSPTNNAFDITAGGSDMFNNADGEYFIGRNVSGNFDIRVRIPVITNSYRGISDANAKGALQARVSTAANSRMITVNLAPATPNGWPVVGADRAQLLVRDTTGGGTANVNSIVNCFTNGATPWVRMIRHGSVFFGFRSFDGVNWTLIGSRDTAVNGGSYPDTILVGLAASSHNNVANPLSGTTTAQFRDLYFPTTLPTITSQPLGANLLIGQNVTISVGANNPPDSGAINYQWRKNGLPINGANGSSITIVNANLSDAANYSVIVANDGGGVISDVATIVVANQGPIVASENLTTVQNSPTNISAGTLLGNDSDPDGRPLSIVAVSGIAPVTFFTDFELGLPTNSTAYGNAHLISGVGVNGSQALAITDATGNQNGGWVINDLVPGRSVSAFSATFKIRLANDSGNAADGMSFNIGNDLTAGIVGNAEEGSGSGLSICLDQYNNVLNGQPDPLEAPAFDVKWRGAIVAHVPIIKATNANWVSVTVNVRSDGTLDLYYTNAPLLLNVQTPFRPISGAQFGFYARTGGQFESHWLDDVSITVLTPETQFAPAGNVYAQNFDYGLPAGVSLYGFTNQGGLAGGYYTNIADVGGSIHLTDSTTNQLGAAVFDEITPLKPVNSFTASFKVRIGNASSEPADGMSFNFAGDLPNTTSGGAEEGVGTGIAVCWDIYRFPDNAGTSANRSGIKVKYRGQTLAQQQIPQWNNTNFIPVTVTLTASGTVMVNIDGTNVFANPVATGYQPIRGRFGFYARTGGQYASYWIDELNITLPDYGYVTLASGNVLYAPPRNACGSDSFYYQVSDGQGGLAWTSANVGVLDVTPPQILACATNRVVAREAGCIATLPDLTTNSGFAVIETCSLSITQFPPAGTILGDGATPVTLYAVDGVGNVVTCGLFVTNSDITAPTISCTETQMPTAPGFCHALNSSLGLPTVADNCTISTVTNAAPTELPIGTNFVIWTAVDASGNSASCTQTVVVVDAELPQITAPANISVPADAGQNYASGVALGTPVVADNCTIANVTNNAPATFPAGTTIVVWTVIDGSGNFATASQSVTVTVVLAPQITCPANVTVTAPAGLCHATNVALGSPVVTGATINTIVTNNAPAQFPIGTNTVTWSVLDPAGTNSCDQLVIVTEGLPLIVTQPLGTNVLVGSSLSFTVSVASCSAPLYQWYLGATALRTQTNADLVLSNATSCDAGSYIVVISNSVGSVTGEVAVLVITNAPSLIAPGGALVVAIQADCGNLLLVGGASYDWEISNAAGNAGTGWDSITASSGIDVQATALNPFAINLISLNGSVAGAAANFDNNITSRWSIASAPDGVTNFAANKFVVNDSGFSNDLQGGVFSVEVGSLAVVFTPNRAPVAAAITKNRGPGLALTFKIADLLTNSVDADGDVVSFDTLLTSTNGATLAADGTYIYYTNANDVADAFTYTVRDTRAYRAGDTTRTAVGIVNITVNAPAGTNLVITTPVMNVSGKPTLRFSGIPGYEYEVQRTIDLTTPITWTPILTTNAPAEGYFELTDELAPPSTGYYRAIRK